MDKVNFSYDKDRQILKDIDMVFEKGKLTAIVGESGSGKSTVASLITGKNKKFDGDLFVSDEKISDLKERTLLNHIAYISHNAYLFNATVRDNLLIAKPTASDDELWRVLEMTNLSDFIKSENGLDTIIKEKASNLSGGQAQRLALARALLYDSEVYIFDEATSNIDVESENDIMKQIYELAKQKTVILISHRLLNVKDADRIYVLDKGKLVGEGSHIELLEKSANYKNMWHTQQELESYRKAID